MKMEHLAPLVLDYCIAFLKERNTGTKYHPEKDVYMLDATMMARIVRHGGKFKAQVEQSESLFFNRMMKVLLHQGLVHSVSTSAKYDISEDTRFDRFAILVEKTKFFEPLKGRKPKFLGEEIYGTREFESS